MPIRDHNPTIRARELQELVLAAIPSLRDSLADDDQVNPHRVMCVLFDHATWAIDHGDVPAFIRCFRLMQQLAALDQKCDGYVKSAIWATFLNRFRCDDPAALSICRDLDPDVRKKLYLPFTFPHTWLRETKIELPGAQRWSTWFTVDRAAEAEYRDIRQMSSCDHYAVLRLRVEPMLENRSISFRNRLSDSADAPLMYVETVIDGVKRALSKWSSAERGVAYLRIELLDLRHHPVDSRGDDFVTAAGEAMDKCVAAAGLVEI